MKEIDWQEIAKKNPLVDLELLKSARDLAAELEKAGASHEARYNLAGSLGGPVGKAVERQQTLNISRAK